jgi:hypothetical protein
MLLHTRDWQALHGNGQNVIDCRLALPQGVFATDWCIQLNCQSLPRDDSDVKSLYFAADK